MYNVTDGKIVSTLDPDGFIPASFYLELLEGGGTSVQTDLSLTIDDKPRPVQKSELLTYSLIVTNIGADATGVTLTDTLPADITFESVTTSQGTCTPTNVFNGNTFTTTGVGCVLGNMADGTSANVEIVIRPNVAGTIWNSASVSATEDDPTLSNNSVTRGTLVQDTSTPPAADTEADVEVNINASSSKVKRDEPLTYTVEVTNNGPDTAENVVLTDGLPSNVNFVSVSGTNCSGTTSITCLLGNLNSGASETVSITVIPFKGRSVSNTVSVTSSTPDPDSDNNTDKEKTRVRR